MSVVLTDINNHLGIITINSERSLNALSLEIVEALQQTLLEWQNNDNIKCVFLQGAGTKAFCAGGDIRQVRQAIEEQKLIEPNQVPPLCTKYFITEYSVDYLIHTYSKPIVVWGDGIVMGGGLGLLAGASHRIVTERSILAMPEISIGLYPDVGASYFLNQMPSAYGLYLGMTGTRFDGADAMFLEIADYYLPSTVKEEIISALAKESDKANIEDTIANILTNASVNKADIPASKAQAHHALISKLEEVKSVQEFLDIISPEAEKDQWVANGYSFLTKGSPSSVFVIFKQLMDSKHYSLEEVFRSELNLTCQFTIHPDFSEGVRALLIDKDQSPKWSPNSISKVTPAWVESHFSPLWSEDTHPFSNLKQ
ncbi:enoyl-CoA hydratase/isomerase family protein [Myroides marinus]|uniref:enoyl-CoA hydratase/isomerase family protein n=1 Tax=Myroides marinus TaxID=703342 RepID=UPI002578DE85|nr:enoyl-CoA hydratase/isomerase family protein [Myroides marinus]MDM1350909.1 enoyl-CoA hydratase/isomerase family protein [Myroides marinus]MDM1358116.1 enoyl-CoA hydratase/isomerase family protein [Myroides marinus]MDM1362525.1 enoyl-CoA hydratase/isomerase family protein [Myroides marinus]MDM1369059.1 enoyl-CoA hydratase/isomerase family protein [Myroides marinus]MDM1372390.1 enoyl-CoA hydratase/isomerase family protein [Myroides marinus]